VIDLIGGIRYSALRATGLGGVRAYLLIIERDPRRVLELLRKPRGKRAA
jgi:hypothetical protein